MSASSSATYIKIENEKISSDLEAEGHTGTGPVMAPASARADYLLATGREHSAKAAQRVQLEKHSTNSIDEIGYFDRKELVRSVSTDLGIVSVKRKQSGKLRDELSSRLSRENSKESDGRKFSSKNILSLSTNSELHISEVPASPAKQEVISTRSVQKIISRSPGDGNSSLNYIDVSDISKSENMETDKKYINETRSSVEQISLNTNTEEIIQDTEISSQTSKFTDIPIDNNNINFVHSNLESEVSSQMETIKCGDGSNNIVANKDEILNSGKKSDEVTKYSSEKQSYNKNSEESEQNKDKDDNKADKEKSDNENSNDSEKEKEQQNDEASEEESSKHDSEKKTNIASGRNVDKKERRKTRGRVMSKVSKYIRPENDYLKLSEGNKSETSKEKSERRKTSKTSKVYKTKRHIAVTNEEKGTAAGKVSAEDSAEGKNMSKEKDEVDEKESADGHVRAENTNIADRKRSFEEKRSADVEGNAITKHPGNDNEALIVRNREDISTIDTDARHFDAVTQVANNNSHRITIETYQETNEVNVKRDENTVNESSNRENRIDAENTETVNNSSAALDKVDGSEATDITIDKKNETSTLDSRDKNDKHDSGREIVKHDSHEENEGDQENENESENESDKETEEESGKHDSNKESNIERGRNEDKKEKRKTGRRVRSKVAKYVRPENKNLKLKERKKSEAGKEPNPRRRSTNTSIYRTRRHIAVHNEEEGSAERKGSTEEKSIAEEKGSVERNNIVDEQSSLTAKSPGDDNAIVIGRSSVDMSPSYDDTKQSYALIPVAMDSNSYEIGITTNQDTDNTNVKGGDNLLNEGSYWDDQIDIGNSNTRNNSTTVLYKADASEATNIPITKYNETDRLESGKKDNKPDIGREISKDGSDRENNSESDKEKEKKSDKKGSSKETNIANDRNDDKNEKRKTRGRVRSDVAKNIRPENDRVKLSERKKSEAGKELNYRRRSTKASIYRTRIHVAAKNAGNGSAEGKASAGGQTSLTALNGGGNSQNEDNNWEDRIDIGFSNTRNNSTTVLYKADESEATIIPFEKYNETDRLESGKIDDKHDIDREIAKDSSDGENDSESDKDYDNEIKNESGKEKERDEQGSGKETHFASGMKEDKKEKRKTGGRVRSKVSKHIRPEIYVLKSSERRKYQVDNELNGRRKSIKASKVYRTKRHIAVNNERKNRDERKGKFEGKSSVAVKDGVEKESIKEEESRAEGKNIDEGEVSITRKYSGDENAIVTGQSRDDISMSATDAKQSNPLTQVAYNNDPGEIVMATHQETNDAHVQGGDNAVNDGSNLSDRIGTGYTDNVNNSSALLDEVDAPEITNIPVAKQKETDKFDSRIMIDKPDGGRVSDKASENESDDENASRNDNENGKESNIKSGKDVGLKEKRKTGGRVRSNFSKKKRPENDRFKLNEGKKNEAAKERDESRDSAKSRKVYRTKRRIAVNNEGKGTADGKGKADGKGSADGKGQADGKDSGDGKGSVNVKSFSGDNSLRSRDNLSPSNNDVNDANTVTQVAKDNNSDEIAIAINQEINDVYVDKSGNALNEDVNRADRIDTEYTNTVNNSSAESDKVDASETKDNSSLPLGSVYIGNDLSEELNVTGNTGENVSNENIVTSIESLDGVNRLHVFANEKSGNYAENINLPEKDSTAERTQSVVSENQIALIAGGSALLGTISAVPLIDSETVNNARDELVSRNSLLQTNGSSSESHQDDIQFITTTSESEISRKEVTELQTTRTNEPSSQVDVINENILSPTDIDIGNPGNDVMFNSEHPSDGSGPAGTSINEGRERSDPGIGSILVGEVCVKVIYLSL